MTASCSYVSLQSLDATPPTHRFRDPHHTLCIVSVDWFHLGNSTHHVLQLRTLSRECEVQIR
jgi:hypothetical protein